MRWEKKGLIYGPTGDCEWRNNSAMKPIPILIDGVIRVYFTYRDSTGAGLPGYVELNPNNPSEVLYECREPLLQMGRPGEFDDNGVVPCTVFEDDGKYYMYYTGFKKEIKVRMTYFSGLGISSDGKKFEKFSDIPVMDRISGESLFRSVQCILKEEDKYKVYYVAGNSFKQGKSKTLAEYELYCLETDDLTKLNCSGKKVMPCVGDEYRIGSPHVFKEDGIYKMYFCTGSETVVYDLAYAESKDGYNWERKDGFLNGLERSSEGWESDMAAYPWIIDCNGHRYIFYNGNQFGYYGFGYAELVEE